MLFEREEIYKIEWNAKRDEFVVALVEQYEVATFDSENDVFFESSGYVKKSEFAFAVNGEEYIKPEITSWKVTIVTGKAALRKTFIRFFASELGVDDIYSATELADMALVGIAV